MSSDLRVELVVELVVELAIIEVRVEVVELSAVNSDSVVG